MTGVAGLVILVGMVLLCIVSLPWTFGIVETGPDLVHGQRRFEAGNLSLNLLPPSWMSMSTDDQKRLDAAIEAGEFIPGRLLGTDKHGRDYLARCLVGGTISLGIGLSSALIAVIIGTAYGVVSGYYGGRLDAFLMRCVDVLYGLPYILLVVLLAVAVDGIVQRMGTQVSTQWAQVINVITLLVAIGGISWLTMSRVIRGQVLSLKARPYMETCRAIGVPLGRQFRLHLLPNLIAPIVVYATLAVPAAILSESFLSFLGIGVREPLPSWGNLAADGLNELNMVTSRWWLLFWPCFLIGMTLLSLNFLGDHLRERFDPTAGTA